MEGPPRCTLTKTHGDVYKRQVRVFDGGEGKRIEIVDRVAFLLPAVGIEQLTEVALLVQQAQADQRIVLVARRFQMIAGKNAQAAGIDRQALRETILCREIGDQLADVYKRQCRYAGDIFRKFAEAAGGDSQGPADRSAGPAAHVGAHLFLSLIHI